MRGRGLPWSLFVAILVSGTFAAYAGHREDKSRLSTDALFVLRNFFADLQATQDRPHIKIFFDRLSGSDPRVRVILDKIIATPDADAQLDAMVTLSQTLLSAGKTDKPLAVIGEGGKIGGINRKNNLAKRLFRLAKKTMPEFNPTGW